MTIKNRFKQHSSIKTNLRRHSDGIIDVFELTRNMFALARCREKHDLSIQKALVSIRCKPAVKR